METNKISIAQRNAEEMMNRARQQYAAALAARAAANGAGIVGSQTTNAVVKEKPQKLPYRPDRDGLIVPIPLPGLINPPKPELMPYIPKNKELVWSDWLMPDGDSDFEYTGSDIERKEIDDLLKADAKLRKISDILKWPDSEADISDTGSGEKQIASDNLFSGSQEAQGAMTASITAALARLKELQNDLGENDLDQYREIVLNWFEGERQDSEILKSSTNMTLCGMKL